MRCDKILWTVMASITLFAVVGLTSTTVLAEAITDIRDSADFN